MSPHDGDRSLPTRHDLTTLHANVLVELAALMSAVAYAPLSAPELEACRLHLEAAALALKDSKLVVARRVEV